MSPFRIRFVRSLSVAGAAIAVMAPPASAGGAITGAVVIGDAVEDRAFTVQVVGWVDADLVGSVGVYAVANAPGRDCAATVSENEPGAVVSAQLHAASAAVQTELSLTLTRPGLYPICTYIDDFALAGRTPIAAYPVGELAVREPAVALALALPRPRVEPGDPVVFTVTGTAEVPRVLSVQINPAGASCGLTPAGNEAATVDDWIGDTPLLGTQVITVADAVAPTRRGTYRLCGYVADELDVGRPSLRSSDLLLGVGQDPVATVRGGEFGPTCRAMHAMVRRGAPISIRCTGDLGTLRVTAKRPGFQRTQRLTLDAGRGRFATSRRFPRGIYRVTATERGTQVATFRVRLR